MKKNKNEETKKCWKCGREIINEGKFGLCPTCVNEYGTPLMAVAGCGFAVGVKYAVENHDKIAKGAVKAAGTAVKVARNMLDK